MRGKESQLQTDHDEYGYQDMSKSKFRSKPRLDLNDLLQRVKDQKKQQKKLNLLIF